MILHLKEKKIKIWEYLLLRDVTYCYNQLHMRSTAEFHSPSFCANFEVGARVVFQLPSRSGKIISARTDTGGPTVDLSPVVGGPGGPFPLRNRRVDLNKTVYTLMH